jgi:hypothetical protein
VRCVGSCEGPNSPRNDGGWTCSHHEQFQRRKGATIMHSGIKLMKEETAVAYSHLWLQSYTVDRTIITRMQWVPGVFAGSKAARA